MKKIILVGLLSLAFNTSANASSYVMCHFNSFSTVASQNPVAVTSSNNVIINNETNMPKTYYVSYQIFINKNLIHDKDYTVNILANNHFEDNRIITSMQKFNKKGNLNASCAVTIMGAEQNRITGGGSITVL